MGRIVIYKEKNELKVATDSDMFRNTSEVLDFINSKKFEVLKYEKDNLFIAIEHLKIKIENYSKLLREPDLYDFNRKFRTKSLKLENKQKLYRNKHQIIKSTVNNVSAVLIGTVIVFNLLTPNADYKFDEKSHEISVSAPVTIQIERVSNAEPKIEFEKIYRHAEAFGIPYEAALNLIKVQGINPNDDSAVLNQLYEYSKNNVEFVKNTLSSEQIEALILKYTDILGVTEKDVIATILAVYRFETGRGTSDSYLYKNNFGGHRSYSKEEQIYYHKTYQTPEIGAYRQVQVFLEIMKHSIEVETKKAEEEGRNINSMTLEQIMNPIYCGELHWAEEVRKIKLEVIEDYDFFKKKVK